MFLAKFIQKNASDRPLRVLFDSGSDHAFIHHSVLPKHTAGKSVSPMQINTLNGDSQTVNRRVSSEHISFPEFSPTQRVDKAISAYVYTNDKHTYDVILGLDSMVPLGIEISCSTWTVSWLGKRIPFKPRSYFDDNGFKEPVANVAHCFHIDPFDEVIDSFATAATTILESKYDHVTKEKVSNPKQ